MSLDKLNEKVENKLNGKDEDKMENNRDEYLEQINRNYRLIQNTNKSVMKQLNHIERKVNLIAENVKLDDDSIERLKEIAALERKLKQLKKEV